MRGHPKQKKKACLRDWVGQIQGQRKPVGLWTPGSQSENGNRPYRRTPRLAPPIMGMRSMVSSATKILTAQDKFNRISSA